MVIDTGNHLEIPATLESDPADHIKLPQLHGPFPLPPLIVLTLATPFTGLHQTMAA